MKLSAAARTFRTIRYLRPSQVYWRLRYRWERGRGTFAPAAADDLRLRDDFPEVPSFVHRQKCEESAGEDFVAEMERGRFRHLNKTRSLGIAPTDWLLGVVADGRLWTITLHYHFWAWRLAEAVASDGPDANRADKCLRHLLADWMDHCRLDAPGSRDLAWNAYAIATRIGWWCRLYHLLGPAGRKHWGNLEKEFLRSLWQQASFLEKHIEWDLRANHLLRDVVGLAWAGRFFGDPAAKRWLAKAADMARDQAEEQVLADGGHFERSPMYHIVAMEDFLTLAVLLEDPAAKEFIRKTWRKMAEFLVWMRHPDGNIPLFNDAALNGACRPGDMLDIGYHALDLKVDANVRRGGKLFAQFGMAVWHGDPWNAFFDVGSVGVDYQPGHAHADTLSIEASFQGERLFVDPGTFAYDNDESRRYDRATASHNTLAIDGSDSSEVWHIFRVGRRALPEVISRDITADEFTITVSHNGYEHLPGRPRHTRCVEVSKQVELIITDLISGKGRHAITGGLLLAPGWTARQIDGGWHLSMRDMHLRARIETVDSLKLETLPRPFSSEFGRRINVQRLAYSGIVELPCKIIWRIEECSQARG